MSSSLTIPARPSRRGEPAWELLELFPEQGQWTAAEYLRVKSKRVVELVDGCLEIPPYPDTVHQLLVMHLTTALHNLAIDGKTGVAIHSPFKLKIPNRNWREPDVSYLGPHNLRRVHREWWDYADLTMEVVSNDDETNRDYVGKPADYAAVGVREYWIVDPRRLSVTILALDGGTYREAQVARGSDVARSVTFPSLSINLTEMFAKAWAHLPRDEDD